MCLKALRICKNLMNGGVTSSQKVWAGRAVWVDGGTWDPLGGRNDAQRCKRDFPTGTQPGWGRDGTGASSEPGLLVPESTLLGFSVYWLRWEVRK